MRKKRKTVWAFLDGKKLVDVVQAALDNNMMVDDLKAKLIAENPGHEVTFKAAVAGTVKGQEVKGIGSAAKHALTGAVCRVGFIRYLVNLFLPA